MLFTCSQTLWSGLRSSFTKWGTAPAFTTACKTTMSASRWRAWSLVQKFYKSVFSGTPCRINTADIKFLGSTLRMKNTIAMKRLPTHRELLDLIFPVWRPDWKARKDCGWGKRGLAGGGCPNIVISGIEAVPLLLTSNPPWFGGKWESRVEQQCIVWLFVSALLWWNSLCLTHRMKQEAKSLKERWSRLRGNWTLNRHWVN